MQRRQFVRLLCGAAITVPAAAAAQLSKAPRIGILVLGNPDPNQFLRELREGLRALGYIEAQTVIFEFRNARGSTSELQRLAYDLAAHKVDVIVTYQTPAAAAAKQATSEIPIVMAPSGDPLATGLIESLSRPGGNITGLASATAELGGKNLELIREVLPSARRVGVLANAPDPFHKPFLKNIHDAAAPLGFEIKPVEIKDTAAIGGVVAELERTRIDALMVQPSLPQATVAAIALKHRLPCLAPTASFPSVGGLMSYSADFNALYREAASFVDKILKGRRPSDLPVQLPTKFYLALNLKTASALGLTLPPTLLARADEVIE